ncbi:FtsX-like permease family protein [Oxalobacteraceae bacterium]|nr:FtsX-like permease family protein [Oxalobacteraceae bacterium]
MEIRPIFSALLRSKTGAVLIALQVAISLAILANALHIVNVRQQVSARPTGVADEGALFSMSVETLQPASHQQQLANYQRDIGVLRALPGVTAAARVNQIPLSRSGSYGGVAIDRKQKISSADPAFYITPDALLSTWGLKLTAGRDFVAGDRIDVDSTSSRDFPQVVMVTRALAEKIYGSQDKAIGQPLFFGMGEQALQARIVGVVERLQTQDAQITPEGEYATIAPVLLTGVDATIYTVRAAAGQRERLMQEAEAALRRASPVPLVIRSKSFEQLRDERYRADHALAWMLITVSVLLLLITASGIVGMASLWMNQRRKQIGVRRALGARRVDILRYFLTENFMITSAGVCGGVILALGLNQLLISQLEGTRLPLAYLLGGAATFWVLGLAAVYGPAWRAASISPALATRSA